jgi:leucyl aminopeptidase
MKYISIEQLDHDKDLILPCRKNQLDLLKEFTGNITPDFEGEHATFQTFYGKAGNRIYALGIGGEKDAVKIGKAFQKLCFDTKKYWKDTMQLQGTVLNTEELQMAIIGMEMGTYQIGRFKTDQKATSETEIQVAGSGDIAGPLYEGPLIGATINRIKALVDAPANQKTPEYLGNWAKESAGLNKYKCTLLTKKELEEQGFDAVLAVGRGSENPPVVAVTEYMARPGEGIDIGLVGKGITFDTGGLSIKPSQNLHYMKSDMGGAAVVLGVVELVARMGLNINIVGVVASAENAVDSKSYRPGDVINSYSKKTIEIIDTDAEGRLVLADGLSYIIQKFQPHQVIDLATLTGSVVRTLAYSAAGMFTNDSDMATKMSDIGNRVNERVWPLPLYEEFEKDLESDIADLRNFSGKPVAGAITAAKFLQAFTNEHKHWMHLDIAGVAFGDSHYAKMKSSTGFGVQLILEYIKTSIKK